MVVPLRLNFLNFLIVTGQGSKYPYGSTFLLFFYKKKVEPYGYHYGSISLLLSNPARTRARASSNYYSLVRPYSSCQPFLRRPKLTGISISKIWSKKICISIFRVLERSNLNLKTFGQMCENNMAQKLPNEKVSVNLYWVITVCLILVKLKCDDV